MSINRENVNETARPTARVNAPGATILLVEDEACVRNLVTRFLALNNFNIVAAEDTRTARAIWAMHKNEIDLLLADVVMPNGSSGRHLAEEFQAEQPELKVLYTSGYNLEALNANGSLDEGVNFIQKPYRPEQLLSAVDAVLAGNFNLHAETLC
jgi:DNA-binding NtrC family response regulator